MPSSQELRQTVNEGACALAACAEYTFDATLEYIDREDGFADKAHEFVNRIFDKLIDVSNKERYRQ